MPQYLDSQLSTGNTAARPAAPGTGFLHFNTETHAFEMYDGASWTSLMDLDDYYTLTSALGAYATLTHNLAASAPPTASDDSDSGYAVGSRWTDTTADKEYVCVDASVAAAVWPETTSSGVADFVSLTDTPGSFSGQANKVVSVNSGETALEFTAAGGGATDFVSLTDTPASYSGQASKLVAVNSGETALEFVNTTTTDLYAGEVLETQVLGAAGTFDFSSIPTGYTELRLIGKVQGTTATNSVNVTLTFNTDTTASNYRSARHNTDSAAHATGGGSDQRILQVVAGSGGANDFDHFEIIVPDYDGSHRKHARAYYGSHRPDFSGLWINQVNWLNTSAIDRIRLAPETGNFAAGSEVTLIGYKEKTIAGAGAATALYLPVVIEDTTLGSDGTLSATIPAGYDKLEIDYMVRSDGATSSTNVKMYFNGDTTDTNYSNDQHYGGSAGSGGSSDDEPRIGRAGGTSSPANQFTGGTITVLNPSSTAQHKFATGVAGDGTYAAQYAMLWESLAVVTSISLKPQTGTDWKAGSRMRVLGWKSHNALTV